MQKKFLISFVIFFIISQLSFGEDFCKNIEQYYDKILEQVSKGNPQAISDLPECFKLDHTLILKAVLLDPLQFQYADEILRSDKVFVKRLLKISADILQFVSPEIKSDADFMEHATYLNRDALKYASWSLLDNKLFMKKMINIDSRNYKFASDRLKEIPEFAQISFEDNGLLLEFAPKKIKSDKNLVKIAIKSNNKAIQFIEDELKSDKELLKLSEIETSIKSPEKLQLFLSENYLGKTKKKNLVKVFTDKGKFSDKEKIIDRNYVVKWQKNLNFKDLNDDGRATDDFRLISVESKNYSNLWRQDFVKYPDLIKKIEGFFARHNIPENTIDGLSTTFLWQVKDKPLTLVFNLYLLRDSTDIDLGSSFSNITSLTAIAQKKDGNWKLTVVEVIFDSEVKVDFAYTNGHKKYIFWDLYRVDKKDQNPKIIFKVEDRFNEYFEVFEEQSGGKYFMLYSFLKPL